jgi:hypothetical protein
MATAAKMFQLQLAQPAAAMYNIMSVNDARAAAVCIQ